MEEKNPNKNDSIFEELEYFCFASVKSMVNGYNPPKKYLDNQIDKDKVEEKVELFEPYEVFNPFDDVQ